MQRQTADSSVDKPLKIAWLLSPLYELEISAAIKQLVRWQIVAKIRSAFRRSMTRRRLPLTIGAMLLGSLWLIQAVAGVIYRNPAAPGQLMKWIPLSLCCYFLWNVLKTFGQKPIEPFNWNESEKEWLLSSPLRRSQVIRYRGAAIIRAAFIKSLVFAVIMSPDLQLAMYGLMGIFLGLIFIDLSRLILEIVVYGLSQKQLAYCRSLIFGATAVVAGGAFVATFVSLDQAIQAHPVATFGILLQLMSETVALTETWFGAVVLAPFDLTADLVLTSEYTAASLGKLILATVGVFMMALSVPWLDQFFARRRNVLEVARFVQAKKKQEADRNKPIKLTAVVPVHIQGIGPLAWRQSFGTLSQFKPLSVSLLIPMILSCLPIMTNVKGMELVFQIVGSLAFYSALLMPASMRFDFRRDIDRLGMLKSLPISPARVCAGQLAVPVLILTGFQIATLTLVQFIAPFNPLIMVAVLIAFVPFNVFLFSFENLLFLWYPYRLHSEGVQVLLRTILAFTAKSISLLVLLLATAVWLYLSRVGVQCCIDDPECRISRVVFVAGMFLFSAIMAWCAFMLLARAFQKFDPSMDLAGLK